MSSRPQRARAWELGTCTMHAAAACGHGCIGVWCCATARATSAWRGVGIGVGVAASLLFLLGLPLAPYLGACHYDGSMNYVGSMNAVCALWAALSFIAWFLIVASSLCWLPPVAARVRDALLSWRETRLAEQRRAVALANEAKANEELAKLAKLAKPAKLATAPRGVAQEACSSASDDGAGVVPGGGVPRRAGAHAVIA
jgi:hypothetical protein